MANQFKQRMEKTNPNGAKGIVVNKGPIDTFPQKTEEEKDLDTVKKDLKIVVEKGNEYKTEVRKSGFDNVAIEPKIKKTNMSIILEEMSKSDLDIIVKQKNKKANALVNNFLEEIFDRKTGYFKIDIEAVKQENSTATTYSVAKDIADSLKKEASKRNMSTSAYFCKLLNKFNGR